jgi:hypothetical protein
LKGGTSYGLVRSRSPEKRMRRLYNQGMNPAKQQINPAGRVCPGQSKQARPVFDFCFAGRCDVARAGGDQGARSVSAGFRLCLRLWSSLKDRGSENGDAASPVTTSMITVRCVWFFTCWHGAIEEPCLMSRPTCWNACSLPAQQHLGRISSKRMMSMLRDTA